MSDPDEQYEEYLKVISENDRLRAEVTSLNERLALAYVHTKSQKSLLMEKEELTQQLITANVRVNRLIRWVHDMWIGFNEVRNSLQFANDTPNGGINDTIWMMHGNETVFDAIDRLLDSNLYGVDMSPLNSIIANTPEGDGHND